MSPGVRSRKGSKENMKTTTEQGPSNNKGGIRFLGFRINGLSPTQEFLFLACGYVVCAMAFAALQEMCFEVEDFKSYKQLLTVITTLVFCLCAMVERYLTG